MDSIYYGIDYDANAEQQNEKYITERCTASKKILHKNRLLIFLWAAADLCSMVGILLPVLNGRYSAPMLLPALIFVKIAATLLMKDKLRNIAGLVFNAAIALLSAHFRLLMDMSAFLFLSSAAHIIAIPCALAVERLKGVSTYPSFNASVFCNEIKHDRGLFNIIKNGYDTAFESAAVRYEFAAADSHPAMKLLRTASILLVGAGLALYSSGAETMLLVRSAEPTDSLEYCYDGKGIKGCVERICLQGSVPLNKGVNTQYWCEFGGQYVQFSVPEKYGRAFAELYNYYAAEDFDLLPYEGYLEVTESSAEAIEFTGVVRTPDKYDDVQIYSKIDRLAGVSGDKINTEFYVEIIDESKAESRQGIGSSLIIAGFLAMLTGGLALYADRKNRKR